MLRELSLSEFQFSHLENENNNMYFKEFFEDQVFVKYCIVPGT